MASVAASAKPSSHSFQQPFEFETSLKVLVDPSTLKVVPSKFNFSNEPTAFTTASLPIVDFSALITGSGDQRSKALHDLIRACQEWGFFILVNHGIPKSLMNATLTAMEQFLSLPDSEKKLEVVLEYTKRTRKLVSKLLKEVCNALELDEHYVDEVLKIGSSLQMFVGNYNPPCPQPDQAIGIPPHTDPGLFTLLIHNGIFTNGRFKSVKHRGVVNSEKERISIVVANGPSRDAVISPAAALVEKDGRAMYDSMKYEEYLESQLTKSRFGGKSMLEQQMIFLGNE
ncbi:hypothetical protein C2S52_005614 [Perilla frutescens var. hirtella]|nr:hypothetical protein C2S52_005614 [Perilla frutescens var. hirtella]